MNEKYKRYAKVLLNNCLKVEKENPLIIKGGFENYDFIRILVEEATSIGISDIYLNVQDAYIKKYMLKNIDVNLLKEHPYFNRKIDDEYAKKGANFLFLDSVHPDLMSDVDPKILSEIRTNMLNTSQYYRKLRDANKLSWLIAPVANISWAKKLFPNEKDPLGKLWDTLFEIMKINYDDYDKQITDMFKFRKEAENILTNLNLKELHFKNSLGTDLRVGLIKNSLWKTGESIINNSKVISCNFPSFEVFTAPHKYKTNGVVYASMPLEAQGVVIEGIKMEIVNGEIVSVTSKTNEKVINNLVYGEKNANYLGEIALVSYDSPIRNTGILFYSTLLDENASCHIAFGDSFEECIKDASNLTDEEKEKIGLNVCKEHIDFMFGTEDMTITGVTFDNNEIEIFKNGNYSKNLSKE